MRRVMVVDDEQDVLASTAMLLDMLGCEVVPVSEPGDVLPEAKRLQPGLILQDLRMPGLNVAGLIAALRSDTDTAAIPVVFFSAHSDIAATAARYDVWGFLRKPFTEPALRQVLDQVFAPDTAALVGDVRRDVRDIFNEQWNVLSAMANYTHVLRTSEEKEQVEQASKGIEDLLLKMEASTDRLHVFVARLADTMAERQQRRPERPSLQR